VTGIRSRTGYFDAQPGKKSSRREEISKCERTKKYQEGKRKKRKGLDKESHNKVTEKYIKINEWKNARNGGMGRK